MGKRAARETVHSVLSFFFFFTFSSSLTSSFIYFAAFSSASRSISLFTASKKGATVLTSTLSSGECAPRMVGPKETASRIEGPTIALFFLF